MKRISDVYEVTLKTKTSKIVNNEILKQILIDFGINKFEIVEFFQWPDTYLSIYFNNRSNANQLKVRLKSLNLKGVSTQLKKLLKKDWLTKGISEFKPFRLTKFFSVVPNRYKDKYRLLGRVPIYIDAELAFGTGLHATTRFMAQFVERCKGQYQSFFDIGTGTGILAIMACKCDAQDINAIDISSDAIGVARKNIITNKCDTIKLKVADAHKIKGKKQYDFVCANIITQELIQLAGKIIDSVKPGKYLAVSGISINAYSTFRKAYNIYPLRCLKIEKGEGWVALLYKKLQE